MRGLAYRLQRGATSQRDRQQSPDRADRSVSGIRPALTGTGWKKPSNLVQGWGAVQGLIGSILRWADRKGDQCLRGDFVSQRREKPNTRSQASFDRNEGESAR